MNNLKSHFGYNKHQRNGILFLLIFIIFLQSVFFFVHFSSEEYNMVSQNEMIAFQQEMGSLKMGELKKDFSKIYPFNPNFIKNY